jgi:hypothetical protein
MQLPSHGLLHNGLQGVMFKCGPGFCDVPQSSNGMMELMESYLTLRFDVKTQCGSCEAG